MIQIIFKVPKTLFVFFFLCLFHLVSKGQYIEKQEKLVQYIKKERFNKIHKQFDDNLSDALSVKKIKTLWIQLEKQLGGLTSSGKTSVIEENGIQFYLTPLNFKKGALQLKTSYNEKGKLSSIYFKPKNYSLPEYGKNLVYNKIDLEVKTGKYALPGELIFPKNIQGPMPVVILVHGSGPQDRYESIISMKVFKDLALGLIQQNIACFLYDKRTLVYKKEYDTAQFTLREETIDDAVSAFNLLRKLPEIDTGLMFIAGHSLGGYALPAILQKCKGVRGGISIAGCARPIEDLIQYQTKFLLGLDDKINFFEKQYIKKQNKTIAFIKNDDLLHSKPKTKLLAYWPSKFWIDLRNYNPVAALDSIDIPVLFIQGERDFQVTMTDFELWKKGLQLHPVHQFNTYPKLNHLLFEYEGKPNPSEYYSGKNVPEYLIHDLSDWIKKFD
ncbi:MAG: DUF3887 domain-containing protein [Flavobacteriales bacterium]|nr:DUF3887 domain-containing protein [Flavobacteriales bacterium]